MAGKTKEWFKVKWHEANSEIAELKTQLHALSRSYNELQAAVFRGLLALGLPKSDNPKDALAYPHDIQKFIDAVQDRVKERDAVTRSYRDLAKTVEELKHEIFYLKTMWGADRRALLDNATFWKHSYAMLVQQITRGGTIAPPSHGPFEYGAVKNEIDVQNKPAPKPKWEVAPPNPREVVDVVFKQVQQQAVEAINREQDEETLKDLNKIWSKP